MKRIIVLCALFFTVSLNAQYHFSGFVNEERWYGSVYLSLIEDYRKLSGVYAEQIIARTDIDSTGYFEFQGDEIEDKHRLYRIHLDNCDAADIERNHFSGHCPDSKEVIFIAKNSDRIHFPTTFENEVFCTIDATNEHSQALMRIDSLKEEMRFDFSEVHSLANTKLKTRKWFELLQRFGQELNEPLAELYIYSFLSDRRSDFYNDYLQDLSTNSYYDQLKARLKEQYPNTVYTRQYQTELASDRFIISDAGKPTFWSYVFYVILGISVLMNIYFFSRWKSSRSSKRGDITSNLTRQEQKILNLLLSDRSNKEIAEQLFVSVSTVKTHVNNIYKKCHVQSRDDLKKQFNR